LHGECLSSVLQVKVVRDHARDIHLILLHKLDRLSMHGYGVLFSRVIPDTAWINTLRIMSWLTLSKTSPIRLEVLMLRPFLLISLASRLYSLPLSKILSFWESHNNFWEYKKICATITMVLRNYVLRKYWE
jgi:hypothetical protein